MARKREVESVSPFSPMTSKLVTPGGVPNNSSVNQVKQTTRRTPTVAPRGRGTVRPVSVPALVNTIPADDMLRITEENAPALDRPIIMPIERAFSEDSGYRVSTPVQSKLPTEYKKPVQENSKFAKSSTTEGSF